MKNLTNQMKAKWAGCKEIVRNSLWVKRHRRVGLFQQYREMWALRINGLSPTDYYKYGLFDPDRFPNFENKKTYGSYKVRDEFRHFSDPKIWAIAYHKHILYRLLNTFGLPIPKIIALYSPIPDSFERHHTITNQDDLQDFLRSTSDFPLFGKPSNASHGYGAVAIIERTSNNQLRLHDGTLYTITEVVQKIHEIAQETGTYLICERLSPSPSLQKRCGEAIPSLRVVTLLFDGVPEIYKATALFPRTSQYISNVHSGSISGDIDVETGIIGSGLIVNSPNRSKLDFHWVDHHPDTQEPIKGYKIDQWESVKDTILEASRAMSPFRMQHWDVTVTNRGPVLLEMNFIGDIEPMQMHGPTGVLTPKYLEFSRTQRVW